MRRGWFLALALASASAGAADRERFGVDTVALEPSTPALTGPFIALVWKSDCAPCLIELGYLAKLQDAAGGRLVSIALDPPDAARAALSERAIAPHAAYAASGDAAGILAGLAGGQTRLPLSVAVTASGEICASHVGLLGVDMAAEWSRTCWK